MINFIKTNKFNQDPLENFFSHIRSRNGNKSNPSLFEFGALFGKIVSLKLLFSSKFSNCEDDGEDILNIDWQALLDEDMSKNQYDSGALNELCLNPVTSVSENPMDSEIISEDYEINSAAIRYFAGYCYLKTVKNIGMVCEECCNQMTQPESGRNGTSEMLIILKQYKTIGEEGGLIKPTDKFFEICKKHVEIFTKIYKNRPYIRNLRKLIVDTCIDDHFSTDWFDKTHPCYDHRVKTLDFFILVLLRKNC